MKQYLQLHGLSKQTNFHYSMNILMPLSMHTLEKLLKCRDITLTAFDVIVEQTIGKVVFKECRF